MLQDVLLPRRPGWGAGRKAGGVNRHSLVRAEKLRLFKLRHCVRWDRRIIRRHNPKDEGFLLVVDPARPFDNGCADQLNARASWLVRLDAKVVGHSVAGEALDPPIFS